jgi:hypothetical protein
MILKLLKLSAINIAVLIGLLLVLNFSAIIIFQGYKIIKPGSSKTRSAPEPGLPNYKNIDWAHKHFKEIDELTSEYRSYIGWRKLPYKGETINIDEQGIRITPQSALATEKSPLVVFLGGSTMWGFGVNDANTIPALFANIAQGRYRSMNLAESGYNAFQGYLFLKLQIINGLIPAIVVAYDGVNDAHVLKVQLRPFGHNREDQIRAVMKGQDNAKDKKDEETLSFSHFFLNPLKAVISQFKTSGNDGENSEKNNDYDFSQERVEQTAKALLEGWLSTKDLAEKNGAYFIAVLQPNPASGKPYVKYLKINKNRLKRCKLVYQAALKLLKTPKYQTLANNVIVLTAAFDLEEYIYIDYCHVSPNGNKIIAEKIYNHIINSGISH